MAISSVAPVPKIIVTDENFEFYNFVGDEKTKFGVTVEFKDLWYKIDGKEILKGLNGKFSPGRLTGILGASGAGKTTLLSILSGLINKNFEGEIYLNATPRSINKMRKLSSYIMQDDCLQPFLTCEESISFAAMLKLGNEYSEEDKRARTMDIIDELGLNDCKATRIELLSGGQRKRLSIALELVNNPSVLFLDEPTTGLDNVTMTKCVELLKSTATKGRTVICTIHQPADNLFKLFDNVYFISDGSCVYNGCVNGIVPFLNRNGFTCPINYGPADFIIECVQMHPENTAIFAETTRNGKVFIAYKNDKINQVHLRIKGKKEETEEEDEINYNFANSFFVQLNVLLRRTFKQMLRDKISLGLQIIIPFFIGICTGLLLFNGANKATHLLYVIKFYFASIAYYMFSYGLAPTLLYPFEIKLLQREYFNRWYSLKAYFVHHVISLLPIMIASQLFYTPLMYFLLGHPIEFERISWVIIIGFLMILSSQGFGYSIGCLFNSLHGVIIATAVCIPLLILAMYSIESNHGNWGIISSVLVNASFPYHGFVGTATAFLDGREVLDCDDVFCPFGSPQLLLKFMAMDGRDYKIEALILTGFVVVHRVVNYFCLRVAVTPDHSLKRFIKNVNQVV